MNFIQQIIKGDLATGRRRGVVLRFPPEPNGYLHIGHAKAICLNFGLAREFQGVCHLRFDDTNPETEEEEFIQAIQEDIKWLGFDWGKHLYFASDYFGQLYEWALHLTKEGLAYVDKCSEEQIRGRRGDLTTPDQACSCRERKTEDNVQFLEEMRAGEWEEGQGVLRAKIDLSAPNRNLRDPILYRIRKKAHPRTQKRWVIYPLYDFAHGQEDAIEHITHSLCTLEFEDHRPLYDWFLEHLPVPSCPKQYEFARLNLDYTVMSKRKLAELVQGGHVEGWDDPRMPTICGMRQRGYPARAIRAFCFQIGVTKKEAAIEFSALEGCVREVLDEESPRVMAVLQPLRVLITNYPEDHTEILSGPVHTKKQEWGRRELPFSREIFIEQTDFSEIPPKGFHRLSPSGFVRLRYAYVLRCDEVIKNAKGEVEELRCTYFSETKAGKKMANGPKVKGIIHWVDARQHKKIETRLYEPLFRVPQPLSDKEKPLEELLNPQSLTVIKGACIENSFKPSLQASPYQFERLGYFKEAESSSDRILFHRVVTLRESQ